jgi:tRNA G18 (ribose-2'-O)-methylase SpoU
MKTHPEDFPAVILVDIRSVHNAASVFRTSDGAGIRKIYLAGITPTPLTPLGAVREDFAKVSLGAEKNIPYVKELSTVRLLKKLKKAGVRLIALELSERSVDFRKVHLKTGEKVAVVLGNEVHGLSKKILELCDEIAEIPMRGGKESLNVSVAAGIFLYHICNQWYGGIKK